MTLARNEDLRLGAKGLEALPSLCYVEPAGIVGLAVVNKGESGYHPSTYAVPESMTVEEFARMLNDKMGVSEKAAHAMVAGSMNGWDIPAVTEFVE